MCRDNVNEYLERSRTSPLRFVNYFYSELGREYKRDEVKITDQENLSLDELVLKVLLYSHSYGSFFGETLETTRNRYRSSLDIWRHVIYYRPEVTIFEVMNSLYKNRQELGGQYCPTVARRVFKLKEIENGLILCHVNFRDEYGLTFPEWENI